ncbi:TIGR03943 family putative permease subunit [Streptomyces fuscichromogenes]|uniref:TIGR03943 family protein n=1 Tax=Streptomyces fuscichromogenes TaxID=1324013 RepID=A0A917XDX4_9ACTN|nr:TIGR03943 family protein [Streptomyces fuscichromogenes]GGN14292.1 TIGR03943 family protein [Streptomyces fuscichromogenes]
MRRPLQVTLLVLSGLGLLHASLFTDLCLRYVKPGMRPLLILSGFVLLVLGIVEAAVREGGKGHGRHGGPAHGAGPHSESEHHHGHDHSAVPRIAWLLLLPALSLLFYAPPALGAYTAARQPAKVIAEQDGFDPLPKTSPLPLTLTDFTTRVQQDRSLAIKARTVQMSGLVTPVPGGGSWDLTRIIISCCAADAQSVKVRIYSDSIPPANTWVSVTGNWHPGGKLGTKSAPVALDAQTVKKIQRPSNGYQDALPFPSG